MLCRLGYIISVFQHGFHYKTIRGDIFGRILHQEKCNQLAMTRLMLWMVPGRWIVWFSREKKWEQWRRCFYDSKRQGPAAATIHAQRSCYLKPFQWLTANETNALYMLTSFMYIKDSDRVGTSAHLLRHPGRWKQRICHWIAWSCDPYGSSHRPFFLPFFLFFPLRRPVGTSHIQFMYLVKPSWFSFCLPSHNWLGYEIIGCSSALCF